MEERFLEIEQEITDRLRDEALAKRVQYAGKVTHCQQDGCGEPLPEARQDIGICRDCADDLERETARRVREGLSNKGA